MSEALDSLAENGPNQLSATDKVLAKSLFDGWRVLNDNLIGNIEATTRMGASLIQNFGDPAMPEITTKDLIKYIGDLNKRVESCQELIKDIKNMTGLTVRFAKKHTVEAKAAKGA